MHLRLIIDSPNPQELTATHVEIPTEIDQLKPQAASTTIENTRTAYRQEKRRSVESDGVEHICRYIFHRDGETTPIGEFRKSWKSALRKAGLSGYRFHGLRRFAAVAHRDAGVPMVVSMRLLGQKTDSMWIRYSIVNEKDQREALEKTQEHRARLVAMGK